MTRPEVQPKHPTGESIAKTIESRDVRNELPYADLGKDLAAAHARRPGMWQQDLEKVNKALHDKGMLPGLDIIGTNGQDLVTRRSKDGKTIIVDAAGHQRQQIVDGGGVCKKFGDDGRTGEMNADGSGKYKIVSGVNTWNVSRDILKAQGNNKPTENQIANFGLELQRYNNVKDLRTLPIGAEIKIPPRTIGGDGTVFTRERAEDQIKGMNDKVQKDFEKYSSVVDKYGRGAGSFRHLTDDMIKSVLADKATPVEDRKALEFMAKNYEQMKFTKGFFSVAENGIYPQQLEQWKANELKKIENARLAYDR